MPAAKDQIRIYLLLSLLSLSSATDRVSDRAAESMEYAPMGCLLLVAMSVTALIYQSGGGRGTEK